uniref:Vespin n=1 Tax=Vespa magnifica TaxID=202807 RepID=VESPI_VESMG|nr:RecName: Full=Vespin; Flags: Precursor [Vespa magnifica]
MHPIIWELSHMVDLQAAAQKLKRCYQRRVAITAGGLKHRLMSSLIIIIIIRINYLRDNSVIILESSY